ncbi:MAG TPA: 6,7-dimethyl-8-ribityllumazine synthase [Bacteroidia bacterium]|nr:6,7-dimethyl-8-ribityllumazine synthase [Bacteroidia bacterium]
MTQPGHDLSHIRYEGAENHRDTTVAIVASKWNPEVLEALLEGARRTLLAAGIPEKQVLVYRVPGSYELPTGAQFAVEGNPGIDAVICLGCVVQGETRHFEFINNAVAQGVKDVSLKYNLPVIFGVLTPDNSQQALDRAGGKYGNKGEEAAVAALEMIDLKRSF